MKKIICLLFLIVLCTGIYANKVYFEQKLKPILSEKINYILTQNGLTDQVQVELDYLYAYVNGKVANENEKQKVLNLIEHVQGIKVIDNLTFTPIETSHENLTPPETEVNNEIISPVQETETNKETLPPTQETEANNKIIPPAQEIEANKETQPPTQTDIKDEKETNIIDSISNTPPYMVIYFDENSEKVSETDKIRLKKIKDSIETQKSIHLYVWGFADSLGDSNYNELLSMQRVKSVEKILNENGFSEEQLELKAFGEVNKFGRNDTEEGRHLNRRVEIRIKQ